MKSLKLLVTAAVVFIATGCQPGLKDCPSKTTPEGISYKVVEVEGRKFIATRSYGGLAARGADRCREALTTAPHRCWQSRGGCRPAAPGQANAAADLES
jgi:hypothetical protein